MTGAQVPRVLSIAGTDPTGGAGAAGVAVVSGICAAADPGSAAAAYVSAWSAS